MATLRRVDCVDAEGRAFLAARHSAEVARRGEMVDAAASPAVVAEDDHGTLAGVITYEVAGPDCEVRTLHVADQWGGVGTLMLEEVVRIATEHGCERLWLVTTNDNVDALRFYQRRGFVLHALRPGAVEQARATMKPSIPPTGNHGIALRDEIELVRDLTE